MTCDLKKQINDFLSQKISFFYDDSFDDPKKQKLILSEIPGKEEFEKKILNSKNSEYADSLVHYREYPVLSNEQELHMFRKMNYLKYRAKKRSESLMHLYETNKWICEKRLKECLSLISKSIEIRNLIASCNLRLAFSVAKKSYLEDHAISEAYYAVFKSIDKFNWLLGFKFSTYATYVVKNELLKLRKKICDSNSKIKKCDFSAMPEKECDDIYYASNEIEKKRLSEELIDKFQKFVDERNKKKVESHRTNTSKYLSVLRSYYGLNQPQKKTNEICQEQNINRKRVHQILNQAISTIKEICLIENIKEDYLA
jgi:RNA polymerase sigma factor (sigma-70 family)